MGLSFLYGPSVDHKGVSYYGSNIGVFYSIGEPVKQCSAGKAIQYAYSDTDNVICGNDPCLPGTYDDGYSTCLSCGPGYSSVSNAKECTLCIAGTYALTYESKACTQCPLNFYSTLPGSSSECLACPSGRITPGLGKFIS